MIPNRSPFEASVARPGADIADDLRQHLELCREILSVIEREHQDLRNADAEGLKALAAQKKELLPRLDRSLEGIRQHRLRWQGMGPADRAQRPDVPPLLRQCQDLTMKIIVLDRENEQTLLRRGLVPTAHLPPPQRQRPHFVTELYRRQGTR